MVGPWVQGEVFNSWIKVVYDTYDDRFSGFDGENIINKFDFPDKVGFRTV